jgi:hypothetical protein
MLPLATSKAKGAFSTAAFTPSLRLPATRSGALICGAMLDGDIDQRGWRLIEEIASAGSMPMWGVRPVLFILF